MEAQGAELPAGAVAVMGACWEGRLHEPVPNSPITLLH